MNSDRAVFPTSSTTTPFQSNDVTGVARKSRAARMSHNPERLLRLMRHALRLVYTKKVSGFEIQ